MFCLVDAFVCLFLGLKPRFVCFGPLPYKVGLKGKLGQFWFHLLFNSLLQSAMLAVCAFKTFLKLIPSSPTMLIQNFQIQFILNLKQPPTPSSLEAIGLDLITFKIVHKSMAAFVRGDKSHR